MSKVDLPYELPASMTELEYAAGVGIVRAQMEDALVELDRLNLPICAGHLSMAIDMLPDIRLKRRSASSRSSCIDSRASGDKEIRDRRES